MEKYFLFQKKVVKFAMFCICKE